MKVICINNKGYEESLTLYGVYEATESAQKYHYDVQKTDYDKKTHSFHSGRFKRFNTIVTAKKYTVTRADMFKLYEVSCPKWKNKIEELTDKVLGLFEKTGEIPSIIVDEMFSAISNDIQLETFNKTFPKYEKDETVFEMKGKGDFFAEGNVRLPHAPMMGVRHSGEHENKAFGLDKKFNWGLLKDSQGVMCLIPTRKK